MTKNSVPVVNREICFFFSPIRECVSLRDGTCDAPNRGGVSCEMSAGLSQSCQTEYLCVYFVNH